jgi:hypothetical protein
MLNQKIFNSLNTNNNIKDKSLTTNIITVVKKNQPQLLKPNINKELSKYMNLSQINQFNIQLEAYILFNNQIFGINQESQSKSFIGGALGILCY